MKIIDLQAKDFLAFQKDFNALASFPAWPFLQTDKWASIQEKSSSGVFLKAIYQDEKVVGFFLAICKSLPFFGKYLYLPRGPLCFGNYQGDFWQDFMSTMQNEFKEKNILFVRLEPIDEKFSNFAFSNSSVVRKSKNIQPASTSFLDLSLTEDDLLKKMAQKTRYNIRLAQKKGVVVSSLSKENPNYEKHFSDFYNLISLTAKRDKFFIHSQKYYSDLVDGEFIRLVEARKDGILLSAGLFSFYDKTVTYLHGASANENRELMAPYLLQWEMIKMAKGAGYNYYDFYGVDDKKWPGVSRFKKGFAGSIYVYPGTFDLVFKRGVYMLYNIVRRVRLLLRF